VNFIIAQAGTISGLDWGIVGVGALLLFVISYVFGREEKNTNDFFLGSRRVPPVVACLSFVAAEISALTIVGIPHTAYTENWRFLQFLFGLALARLVVAFLFIPAFYKHNCTSIYEFLGHRFGPATQYTGSTYFFITRLIASGVRLYATCMAVGIIMGWPLAATITLFTVISIAFIAFGGIKAVVWAGAYQALFFVVAGVVIVGYLIQHIDGGLVAAMQTANKEELLSTFYFKFDLKDASTFWAFLISGFFIGLVSFGTDQEMVQRLLTVETFTGYIFLSVHCFLCFISKMLLHCHRLMNSKKSFHILLGTCCLMALKDWFLGRFSWQALIRRSVHSALLLSLISIVP